MLTTVAPSRLPVEEFQKQLYQICGVFQAEPVKGRDMLNGGILLEDRAGFEMAHVAKDLLTVRRTRRDIRKDSGENFFLIVQEEGRAMMSQRDCTRMLQPGDMILIDSAIPSEFHFFRFVRAPALGPSAAHRNPGAIWRSHFRGHLSGRDGSHGHGNHRRSRQVLFVARK